MRILLISCGVRVLDGMAPSMALRMAAAPVTNGAEKDVPCSRA